VTGYVPYLGYCTILMVRPFSGCYFSPKTDSWVKNRTTIRKCGAFLPVLLVFLTLMRSVSQLKYALLGGLGLSILIQRE
jgi:glycopeptide antibiotics resistance protein